MTNPNPSRITNPMWRLWTDRPDSTWRLGGIYADKVCYHNTVTANLSKWPDAYCIRLPLDLVSYNRDKARAIDFTMSTEKMILYTTRLRDSALHPEDNRLNAIREFYGTLDGKTVYGLMQDKPGGPWRFAKSDTSHLWHIHEGYFTAFVNNWEMLEPVNSVHHGQSWDDWKVKKLEVTSLSDAALQQVKNAVLWEGYDRDWSISGRTLAGTVDALWNNTASKMTEILTAISKDTGNPIHLDPEQIPVLAGLLVDLMPKGGTFTVTPDSPTPPV